jgi:hypothetical protein
MRDRAAAEGIRAVRRSDRGTLRADRDSIPSRSNVMRACLGPWTAVPLSAFVLLWLRARRPAAIRHGRV